MIAGKVRDNLHSKPCHTDADMKWVCVEDQDMQRIIRGLLVECLHEVEDIGVLT